MTSSANVATDHRHHRSHWQCWAVVPDYHLTALRSQTAYCHPPQKTDPLCSLINQSLLHDFWLMKLRSCDCTVPAKKVGKMGPILWYGGFPSMRAGYSQDLGRSEKGQMPTKIPKQSHDEGQTAFSIYDSSCFVTRKFYLHFVLTEISFIGSSTDHTNM